MKFVETKIREREREICWEIILGEKKNYIEICVFISGRYPFSVLYETDYLVCDINHALSFIIISLVSRFFKIKLVIALDITHAKLTKSSQPR